MKVLVLDDDPNAQKILKLVLEKTGCDPLICSEPDIALTVATSGDAPLLVIVAWKPGGIDGPEFCRKVRGARQRRRPFLLMLSSQKRHEDVAIGLDAGADDYVTNPFNLIEFQARLRAALRLIQSQEELLAQLEESESLAQRNSLLGEIISRQHAAEPVQAPPPVPTPEKSRKPAEFTHHEIRFLLSSSLLELKLLLESVVPITEPVDITGTQFAGWSGLLLVQPGVWTDIALMGDSPALSRLFERSLNRKPAGSSECVGFLAEICRVVATGLQRTLRLRAGEINVPLRSRARLNRTQELPPSLPPHAAAYALTIEGQQMTLVVGSTLCPALSVGPEGVRELDVLAEAYPPRTVTEVPMLKAGSVMTGRLVERIRFHEEETLAGVRLSVRRPSGLARFFCTSAGERLLD